MISVSNSALPAYASRLFDDILWRLASEQMRYIDL